MNLEQSVLQASPGAFWFWLIAAIGATGAGFYLAFKYLRRLRILEDTPTARIRSAAQGYGEFEGIAQLLPGEPIESPLTHTECVWYHYKVEEKIDSHHGKDHSRWKTIESETSDSLFLLVDPTGQAIIDPDHADVIPTDKDVWYGGLRRPGRGPSSHWSRWLGIGRYRYTEQRIHPHDSLYVMGLFTSMSDAEQSTFHEDVSALLRSWKNQPTELARRFDHNQDGHIDGDEWDHARRQASEQVASARLQNQAKDHTHVLRKPTHRNQPYLLSALSQHQMIQRFQLKSGLAIAAFFSAGASAVWMINVRLL